MSKTLFDHMTWYLLVGDEEPDAWILRLNSFYSKYLKTQMKIEIDTWLQLQTDIDKLRHLGINSVLVLRMMISLQASNEGSHNYG